MRTLAVVLSTLLVGATAFAAQSAGAEKRKPAKPAMHKTHVIEAEIVSVDTMAKTLTVKGASGNSTVKVDPAAAGHLKDLRAGDKVRLTCRDNEKGEHQAVTQIVVEKATAKK